MMFRIHFTVKGYEDSMVIQADTIEEIRAKATEELMGRGLVLENCGAWSERIDS